MFFKNKRAEGSVETSVKVMIAITLGALVLFASYFLLDDVTMPKIVTIFDQENNNNVNSDFNNPIHEVPTTGHNTVIAEGGTYKQAGKTFNEGESFPRLSYGDTYVYGDYKYEFGNGGEQSDFGWNVKVLDKNKTSYGEILDFINGYPVRALNRTFENCQNLIEAPIIPENVIDMYKTFSGCKNLLKAPDIPRSVVNMESTFSDCHKLELAPKIPEGVINMIGTFEYCYKLKTAPAIPGNVENLNRTFAYCTKLEVAPILPNKLTEMEEIFRGCSLLKTYVGSTDADGDFSGYRIPEGVTNMYSSFWGSSLTAAPVIPDSVINMSTAFGNCENLLSAPVIPKNVIYMEEAFAGCYEMKGIITVNANPSSYFWCLSGTQITEVVGDTKMKSEILSTKGY